MATQKRTKTEVEPVSWAPQDQEAGGGLLTDVDVDFVEVECTTFDYNGTVDPPVPALRILMRTEDGQEANTFLSCGDLAKIVPSDDGTTFVPAEGSSAKGIPATSNGGEFMRSLGDAGYPFSSDQGLPDDYDPRNIQQLLQGMNAHILRVPQKERKGIAQPEAKEGKKKFAKEVPTVTKINRLPWEKKSKAAGKVAGKITPKATGKKVVEEEEEDDATAAVVEVVTELLKSKKYAKSGINIEDDLYNVVFAATKQRPDRKALIAALGQIDWSEQDGFVEDEGTLTLEE